MLNKKGQILDLIYLAFILFMIAVVGLIVYKVMTEWNDNVGSVLDAENTQMTQNYEDRLPNYLQQIFMIVLIGVSIIALISAFMVNSHPVFYGFFMLLLGFLSWINAMYANLWYSIASNDLFSSLSNNLTMINYVMKYYPLVLFVIGLIIGIAMMAKE